MKKLIYFLEEIIQSALPGKWLVDSIPVLQKLADWFPGTHFKQVAKKWRAEMDELANTPHEYVKSQLSAGTAIPSLTSSLLNEQDTAPEKEDMIKWAALTLYAAGMETSTSVSSGFFLAMALYPEVLRKAQEEVDSVIGHNRLPSILDRDQFPYVNAPLESYAGVSHKSWQDDTHNNYFIPKGTIILANVHHMLHNPSVYRDPNCFSLERFLGDNPERPTRHVLRIW